MKPSNLSSGGTARDSLISRKSSCSDSREHGTESADFISGPAPDGSSLDQRDAVKAIDWAIFHALALYSSASYWLRFKRVCAWHQPKQIRMGGNPFASKVTHGICPKCLASQMREIELHAEGMKSKAA